MNYRSKTFLIVLFLLPAIFSNGQVQPNSIFSDHMVLQRDVAVAVRFGWRNIPVVNLFNKDSLPASPFRTDV